MSFTLCNYISCVCIAFLPCSHSRSLYPLHTASSDGLTLFLWAYKGNPLFSFRLGIFWLSIPLLYLDLQTRLSVWLAPLIRKNNYRNINHNYICSFLKSTIYFRILTKLILQPVSRYPAVHLLIMDKAANLTYSHTNFLHFYNTHSYIRAPDSMDAYIQECNAH